MHVCMCRSGWRCLTQAPRRDGRRHRAGNINNIVAKHRRRKNSGWCVDVLYERNDSKAPSLPKSQLVGVTLGVSRIVNLATVHGVQHEDHKTGGEGGKKVGICPNTYTSTSQVHCPAGLYLAKSIEHTCQVPPRSRTPWQLRSAFPKQSPRLHHTTQFNKSRNDTCAKIRNCNFSQVQVRAHTARTSAKSPDFMEQSSKI